MAGMHNERNNSVVPKVKGNVHIADEKRDRCFLLLPFVDVKAVCLKSTTLKYNIYIYYNNVTVAVFFF